jgi:hypothetical protein
MMNYFINTKTGEVVMGNKPFGNGWTAPPSSPAPGVTHAVLDENGEFVEWGQPSLSPNISEFLRLISYNSYYQTWVNQLNTSEALSLALTLDRGNLTEFQLAYNSAKNRVNPNPLGVTEWQALANQNNINVTF